MRAIVLTLLLMAVSYPDMLFAKNALSDQYDISLKTGGHTGQITEPPKEKGATPKRFGFGGAPIALVFNKDSSLSMSVLLEIGFIMDVQSQQVTKQGFYGGVAYHVMGGARRIVQESDFATISRANPYNLSLVFMGGLQNFSASEADNTNESVAGAIFETVGGLQYRYDLWDASVGIEFLQILVTLPASTERLSTVGTTIGFFWRTFI